MSGRIKALWRSLRLRRRLGEDMDDEMSFHIEQYQRDLARSGVPTEEAARRARREFGNIGQAREECREAKGLAMFDEISRNTCYAFRQLRRSPGFAIAVILTLGLCIGANTAVFSVINAALLRPAPYPAPDRLFDVVRQMKSGGEVLSNSGQDGYAWEALKDAHSLQVAAVGGTSGVNLGADNRAIYVQQERVSAGYFRVLGVPLTAGREFNREEDRAGGPAAVVLSYGIWNRVFNGDTSIVGRTILLRGEPCLVVGIASKTLRPQEPVDLWLPLRPSTKGEEGEGLNYGLIARLNAGVTLAEADAEVQRRGILAFEGKRVFATARMTLAPFGQVDAAALRTRLLILFAAVGVVLLIGCVNIALLMLARGSARGREMGTRVALGGGPGSLMRQLITEALVLGAVGGAVGLALGYLAIEALQTVAVRYGVWQELRLDGRVLLATTLLSLLVSIVFGLAPTMQATRVDIREVLLEGGSLAVEGNRSHWLRRILVLSEVAFSLVLLVGAGLLVRTLLNLQQLDPGFDGTNVLTASASLQDARYSESATVNRLYSDSLETIRKIPGVESAAVGLHVPYQRWLNEGVTVRGGGTSLETASGTSMNYVTPGYFKVLHIPLRAGRVFDERDTAGSEPVAVVNAMFARQFLKGEEPLTGYIVDGKETVRIVGVVGDLQQQPGLSRVAPITQEPAMYVPASQFSSAGFQMAHTWYSPNWVVRATGSRAAISEGIERAIADADPLLPVASVHSMVDERDLALQSQRINAWLLGTLAALAFSLALVGVYGIVANSVAERTREFGLRMALGSSVRRLIWNAMSPGVVLTGAGAAIGGILSLGAVKVLKGLLYGVQPIDGSTFLIVAAILVAISAIASLIPALAVTHLAPATVLRHE